MTLPPRRHRLRPRRPQRRRLTRSPPLSGRPRHRQARLRRRRHHLRCWGGSNNPNCNTGLQYSCGQIGPGGGTVFYAVSQAFSLSNGYTAACGNNNCHYMEAQTAQLPPMAWCVGPGATTSISPGTGAAIGTGYSNTQTMATFSGYCSSGAANAAIASTSGGYTDWYVPSQDEATPFFDFLRYNSWPANNCWTSSQSSAKNATYFAVQGSFQQANLVKTNNKTSVCLVRAF
jgi:hypothetical protein